MAVMVYTIEPVWFESNCYLVTTDMKTAVAIDTAKSNLLEAACRDFKLEITHVLLTHGHYDHLSGCAYLQSKGVKIGCLDLEKDVALGDGNLAKRLGYPLEPFHIDFTFHDGEVLHLNGMDIKVIATPGHTKGSCCFLAEPNRDGTDLGGTLFTGDTLFAEDIGRTDLPTGNPRKMLESVNKLLAMEGEYVVYPGHGEWTLLGRERDFHARNRNRK